MGFESELIKQNEDQQNDEQQAQAPGWEIPPATAMGPSRQGSDDHKNDEYEKDGAKHGKLRLSLSMISAKPIVRMDF